MPTTGMRTAACGSTGGAAAAGAGAGTATGAGTSAAADGAAPAPSSNTMGVPWLTLSPILTRTWPILPAKGEGTSMVALSLSSVTSGSSAFTASPGFTLISMTGTFLKSPMSGTVTVVIGMLPASAAAGRRGGDGNQALAGLRFSGSMPYFAMASATFVEGILFSSASALSADATTKCRSTSKW